ncbi:MAG: DUF362 domain-containing protein [Ignavibacteriaceae bacterium]|jgi:uncharacterized protein (DUF362 family)
MDRRKFIKASLVTSGAVAFGGYASVYPFIASSLSSPYDLVAIKGGEPEAMFDKAIASLGGMKNFVKKNQKVVIKPNIGWDVKPELAANTNPKLVARIIKHCFDAGAKDVYVFDHTCDNGSRCYSNSGIERAVKDAGGKIVSGESESYYHQVDIKKGKRLTNSKVHELILESDVFINVPILKHHGGGKITAGMKNLMGVVWDRRYWHQNDLHQCIADFATFKKPDLNIVDAYLVMKRNGPRGVSKDDLLTLKSQIISTDIVATDAAAAKLFGIDLADVPYINYADELKAGRKDLSKLNINRIIM